ncbi:sulfite exporter TauE/SafE family protein [Maribacter algicola]|uniref:Sulfite exporter TauE/SafE family protein n=1 Tax=Meishania litoralis TaxID=3434685 RepID=A0ACC7LG79_9FLAO
MLDRYLPVFIILAILAEILGTVGGFGSSVYFVPIANFFLDFQSVLGITALFHLSSNISKIAMFKKGFDKKIVMTLGIPAVLFVSVGAWLSKFIDATMLTYLLGIFLIALSLIFLIFRKLVVTPNVKNSIIGGSLSGLSAGVLGTGGAIRGITLAAFKMDKNKFIATSAIIDLGVDLSRSIVYYFNGYMRKEHLYLVPILLVVSILGTWVGKKILDRITQEQFRGFVLFLILGIGIASIVSEVWK